MIVEIRHEAPAFTSYAAERTRGLYNVDAEDGRRFELDVDVPIEREDWQIGVVVGPSGSGKTSIASGLIKHGWVDADVAVSGFWSQQAPVIEDMTERAGNYAKATAALASVGLGSVPSWLRPHHVLSNGEQFRANMAAFLVWTSRCSCGHSEAEDDRGAVLRCPVHGQLASGHYLDEFTSVLDRQVAKVGAGAFAKQWRRQGGRRVVLVTPHYDILEWVQPDWWIDTAEGADRFAADREVVRARKGTFPTAGHRARYRGNKVGTVGC